MFAPHRYNFISNKKASVDRSGGSTTPWSHTHTQLHPQSHHLHLVTHLPTLLPTLLPNCMLGYTLLAPLHDGIYTPCPIVGWDTHTHLWTDTCKNITFPQLLLRVVNITLVIFLLHFVSGRLQFLVGWPQT